MPHEIDAVKLVAEALAGRDGGLEIGFAEYIGVDLGDGDDGGVAGLAADQRNFAEEIAGSEASDLVVGADHLDLAFGNQHELLAGVALANDDFTGGVMALRHFFRDVGELSRRQGLEQIDRAQELANPQRIVQDDVGHDPPVDHVDEAIGAIDNPVIVGDHHHRRAVLDGRLL